MKLGPTMDGRIKIVIDHENDFNFFAELLKDAIGDESTEALVNRIAKDSNDEDWEEFVKPDLITQFKKEILTISKVLAEIQGGEEKEFFISTDNARDWYSTLNQARLNLESNHSISNKLPEINPEEPDTELLEAGMKSDFYMQIQGLILETMEL